MNGDMEAVKQAERDFHDVHYDTPLLPIEVEEIRRTLLQPCYADGIHRRTDNLAAFHEILAGQWKDKVVLDYVCGNGSWAVYFALLGAKEVFGFDISENAIRRACVRVEAQGLADKVHLEVKDATKLDYMDDFFEIAIGHGVLHHVIKYPGIAENLYRVMKPGSKAYFFEGLADFPLYRLWWKIKGEVPEGDVPIFAKDIRETFSMFSRIEIIGDDFLFSIKRLLWKENMGRVRKTILRAAKKLDEILFSICPPLRRWGCFSYIILTK